MDERLKEIDDAWKKYYPKHFAEREFFEDLMSFYRYKATEGWKRTREIAKNFKAVYFYKDFFELDNVISTKFERKIEKLDLELLFSMANYLDALLLIDGKTVIDQQFIEELERKQ